ncbi:MAG TPA: hypothetical protein VGN11_06720 [Candidatus Baltobacteraceae bacterium]|jgi:hypothetical protein|nr:hypothetical protein [Candidatus Baltobacteraceae bacterium]
MNPKKFRGLCTNKCGKEIKAGATKYCSLRCQHQQQFKNREAMLLSGLYPPVKNPGRFLRRFLILRFWRTMLALRLGAT